MTKEERQKMNNPMGIKVGDFAYTDKGRITQNTVKVIALTPNHMFATVKCNGVTWEITTRRLTKKFNN